jgi:molybdopterin/thiamine biosynthesis adenylyltransferase
MTSSATFRPEQAFERNLGLIDPQEQSRLLRSRVALAGCGGVGGVHAHTLARLGVGAFTLADPDTFSLANFNRQIGATVDTIDAPKARVTARMIHSINPEADVRVIEERVCGANVDAFLDGADLVIDGVDFFALESRRMLAMRAWERGIPVLIAAPLGFSGTLHVFARGGMSFDEYFDLHDGQDRCEQYVSFLVGLAPSALHAPYTDISTADPASGRAPSSVIGSQMAACVAGAEAVRILLGRGASRLAPHYLQVDVYRRKIRSRRAWLGNRGPIPRLKRWLVRRYLAAHGLDRALLRLEAA